MATGIKTGMRKFAIGKRRTVDVDARVAAFEIK